MQVTDFRRDRNLKELTEHRTVVLPVACYETTITENIHRYIPLHWHDEIQFVLVTQGEAFFQVNEEKTMVRAGEGLFINSGCLHLAEDLHDSGCVYICLNVAPEFVLPRELYTAYVYPYVQATSLPYIFLNPQKEWGASIVDAVRSIYRLVSGQPLMYEIDIMQQLACIWKNLIAGGFPLEYKQEERLKSERMKRMLNYVHLHYAEKISLEDIARAGQLSRSECCRYFKKMLHQSPLSYVIDYRIQRSLLLLRQPDANVTDVAYLVGFNSTSYFIDVFRKVRGVTPLAYKKNWSS
ncbi:AraC family transcriptional regulator [Paenibacillus tepidiphilus]|uniref:AraC family transcriptional regulator n=1 Tax=Paenibacillus tepidiphilus TaxID=2608683 RepID=UPI00123A8FAE|nr:AraC family transcriptional regulator [Paenibacillus tepidiphilus]